MMAYLVLPFSPRALRQAVTVDFSPAPGQACRWTVELRYLPAAGRWFLTVTDAAAGQALASLVPVTASRGQANDLLAPFRHRLRASLLCLPASDAPGPPDPGPENLAAFDFLLGEVWA